MRDIDQVFAFDLVGEFDGGLEQLFARGHLAVERLEGNTHGWDPEKLASRGA